MFGSKYEIPSGAISELTADFIFVPPIARLARALVADLIFTDNYGDEHRVRSTFHPIGRGAAG